MGTTCLIKIYRIKNFIKHFKHYVYGKVKGFWFTRGLTLKFTNLGKALINICFTGVILSYIVTHRNFFSYGLLVAVIMFYIKWLRKIFISKSVADVDKL